MRKNPITSMTPKRADQYSDALADVLCWLNGFLMGKGEDAAMPPGWRLLGDLSADLKEHSALITHAPEEGIQTFGIPAEKLGGGTGV